MNTTAFRFRRLVLSMLPWALAGAPARPAQADGAAVNVYTSANFAPLMLSDGRGVYPDLITHLNRIRPGGLTFKLHYLPRKRLQVQLEHGGIDGIVIGMMPEWLDDRAQKKYLWSAPFARDGYVLVSLARRALRPDTPAALAGATVGITLGYVYAGIDPWLDKSRMVRRAASSDETNLEQVIAGRLDCAVVAESMARYFLRMRKLEATLHVVPLAPTVNERRFLAPRSQQAVFDKLAPAIKKLQDDPAWKATVAGYE